MARRDKYGHLPFCRRLNVFRPRLLQSPFVIQRQSSLMACRDKYGHLPLFSKTPMSFDRDYYSLPYLSRDNQVRWHTKTNMFIYPFCRRLQCFLTKTIEVSRCHQRKLSLMGRRDKYGHLPFLFKTPMSFNRDYCNLPLSSRDNQVWWHTETNLVICPFSWRLQCLSTEAIAVSLFHPETIKSDGPQTQIWSSAPFFGDSNVFQPRLLQSPFVI